MAIVVPEGPVEPWPAGFTTPGREAPGSGETAAPVAPSPMVPSPTAPPQPAAFPQSPMPTRAEWRASRRAARRARRHAAVDSGEAGLIFGVVLVVLGALFLCASRPVVRLPRLVADRDRRPRRAPARRRRQARPPDGVAPPGSRRLLAGLFGPVRCGRVVVHLLVLALSGAGVWPAWPCSCAVWSGYRSALLVADTSTSTIGSLAAGEVRISGVIEAAELTLVSLLQSAPCVYYRATIGAGGDVADRRRRRHARSARSAFASATRPAASGSSRAAPGSTHRVRFDEETGAMGDEPPGLRSARAARRGLAEVDRADRHRRAADGARPRSRRPAAWRRCATATRRRRLPRDPAGAWRLRSPIVGRALPFPTSPTRSRRTIGTEADRARRDPEIAADIAEARAAGTLVARPRGRLGQRRDPGVRHRPAGDRAGTRPGRRRPAAGDPAEAARAERTFEIAPGDARRGRLGRGAAADRLRQSRRAVVAPEPEPVRRSVCWAPSWRSASAMVLAVSLIGGGRRVSPRRRRRALRRRRSSWRSPVSSW